MTGSQQMEAAATPGLALPEQSKALPSIALLTGGADKPYALGLATALSEQRLSLDFIGSDEIDGPQLHGNPLIHFFNLRGDQRTNVASWKKALRVLVYYLRLLRYAALSRAGIFHVLWNNKFEHFDRTVLMWYYRLLGKRVVFTAHNVNTAKRDGHDSALNRWSLRMQYRLSSHIFVHSEKMKRELLADFSISPGKVSVIPFGINNTVPSTPLTRAKSREHLGLAPGEKVVLFFGNIAPYKGLEFLIESLGKLNASSPAYRLIIAGRPKNCDAYWARIQETIARTGTARQIVQAIDFIPDEEIEIYFKAADVLALPYTHIFQSGVLFLAYSFGLPVIAANVGSLGDEIVEGRTGFLCNRCDVADLAKAIEKFFASDLFRDLPQKSRDIRNYANERYSWTTVGQITRDIYLNLSRK